MISVCKRFIFCRVPRTASTAIANNLTAYASSVLANHQTCLQLGALYDLDKFFKFAVVRNPFDRFVSATLHRLYASGRFSDIENTKVVNEILHRVCKADTFRRLLRTHVVFRSQAHMVLSEDGVVLPDLIGRYETLQESFDEFSASVNLDRSTLRRKNTYHIPKLDYRLYYDIALVDKVADLYSQDLQLFGYNFEGRT